MIIQRLSVYEKEYIIRHSAVQTEREIAEWIGCSTPLIGYYRKKFHLKTKRIKWSRDQDDRLLLYIAQGYSIKQIASMYGTKRNNIYIRVCKLKSLGLISGNGKLKVNGYENIKKTDGTAVRS